MAFVYTATTVGGSLEVIIPTQGFAPDRMSIILTREQKGTPDKPEYYEPEHSVKLEFTRADLRTMLSHLEKVI